MKDAFDASGRITEEAAQNLPHGLFVRALGMDGCENLTLYKRLTTEGLQVACVLVDVEADEVLVEFDRDGHAKILTEKLTYILFSSEMLDSLSELALQAYEAFADWDVCAQSSDIDAIENERDAAKAQALLERFSKKHAKTLDKWVKVR